MMGVAVVLALRFYRWSAWILLALFAIQFPVSGTIGRLVLTGIYATIAFVRFGSTFGIIGRTEFQLCCGVNDRSTSETTPCTAGMSR